MDVFLRLRVVIWVLVLSLWGLMVYQFLGEEEGQAPRPAPFVSSRLRATPPSEPQPSEPPAPALAPETVAINAPAPTPPPEIAAAGRQPTKSSLDYIRPLKAMRPRHKARQPMRHEEHLAQTDPKVPPGFAKTATRHFNVYSEGGEASQDFIDTLENLHGNLMLDLASFSPWASEERVSIYLFKSQDSYHQVTGRPPWSGGASSVPKRKVYVYDSEELPGILAHELTHIYFDGFFLDGEPDPLWLSEGMATLVQVERGLAAPNWLRDNLEILGGGGGFSLEELMDVTTTADAPDDRVRLWYAESYSVVRFLLRSQYRSSFYKFAKYLREGKDATQALYRSYGMPYNRIKALEYAWRYQLTSSQLNRLSASGAQ